VSAVSEGQGGHVTKEQEKRVIRPSLKWQKRAGAKTLEAFSVAALIFYSCASGFEIVIYIYQRLEADL
jgi:hypothetical protein